ncbi:ATP-binding cassette domain-containing protein [Kocuria sp. cx-455]|uniref:ABC transporter ATP-binding protein n=1 Tax=Kocuria sp. cx-455 TaxID=2771377 RepID=UPI0016856D1A|nr:ATP-binding cassette domain-containing protein [Kocuria sp. cx-455]MBD2764084.1 ATP-binding cassette domain-containing protein [Kocuria sp. cx-455]
MSAHAAVAQRGADVALTDFGWHYPGRDEPSLRRVSARIRPGERVLLLGPSGAGKSTLLQALAGVEQDPDGESRSGTLTVNGVDPRDARGLVGFMHQDPETQVIMGRVGDDVAFGLENLAVPRDQIWPRVEAALAEVGLDLPLQHPTTSLSGGQKQRLALAGTMAMRPQLLLLDEPTASVDERGAVELRDAVDRAVSRAGTTMIVVEHRVGLWESVVDRVMVLDDHGSVAFDGPTREVLGDSRELLQRQGTWVPGWTPHTMPAPAYNGRAAPLLEARELAVSRTQPSSRVVARRRRRERKAWSRGTPGPGETCAAGNVVPAARDITLTVRAGQALAITGENGAGKSTLALTLAGLLLPVAGIVKATANLAGNAPADPSLWEGTELITRIGSVFQHPEHQFLCSSVRAELEYGPLRTARHGAGPGADQARIDTLLRRLGLTELQDANPFTLSGGQKRRLSVATVLASAPEVLILDEPTFGQDAQTWRELVDMLVEEMERGTAVVAVTHDRELLRALNAVEVRLGA